MKKTFFLALYLLWLSYSTFSQTTSDSSQVLNVAILVYPGVELLDFTGPTEVFSQVKNYNVFLVSAGDRTILTSKNTVTLTPAYTIANAPQPDILVVPGAPMEAVAASCNNDSLMEWIQKVDKTNRYTMSVCTGAFILNQAGVFHNKIVTTHAAALDYLKEKAPSSTIIRTGRWVEDDKLVTTAGVSAGIDGALHIVNRLEGEASADFAAKVMQYDYWKQNSGTVVTNVNRNTLILQNKVVSYKKDKPLVKDGFDPTCGMPVQKGDTITTTYKGKQYGFCSQTCKEAFLAKPDAYAKGK